MTESGQKVLLVEDEIFFAGIVKDYLVRAGYEVQMMHTGVGVVDSVRNAPPNIILLDIMLPGIEGTEICKKIREFTEIPVIMLTAKVAEIDRLLGYGLGVDDYICKPVKPVEILARVKAVLRRAESAYVSNSKSKLQIDEAGFSARLNGVRLDLTPVEFKVLQLLSSREGRLYSRNQIMDQIYENEAKTSDRAVDSHIKNLRKKMNNVDKEASPIQSIYGVGYKFEWPQ